MNLLAIEFLCVQNGVIGGFPDWLYLYKPNFNRFNKAVFYIENTSLCLFVCLGFFVPLENFSFILRCRLYRWRTANFDLCSALIDIERWGFLNVPYPMWHWNPFIMVTSEDIWHSHRLVAQRLEVELSLRYVHRPKARSLGLWYMFRPRGDRTPISRMRSERSTTTTKPPPRFNESADKTWMNCPYMNLDSPMHYIKIYVAQLCNTWISIVHSGLFPVGLNTLCWW